MRVTKAEMTTTIFDYATCGGHPADVLVALAQVCEHLATEVGNGSTRIDPVHADKYSAAAWMLKTKATTLRKSLKAVVY